MSLEQVKQELDQMYKENKGKVFTFYKCYRLEIEDGVKVLYSMDEGAKIQKQDGIFSEENEWAYFYLDEAKSIINGINISLKKYPPLRISPIFCLIEVKCNSENILEIKEGKFPLNKTRVHCKSLYFNQEDVNNCKL